VKALVILGATIVVAACSSAPRIETVSTDARIMTGGGVTGGDCAEANRRAAENPQLDVDSVPRPVQQWKRPFPNMPSSVRREIEAKGSNIKVDVVVDTLGRPVMNTFTVIETSHPWLAQSYKASLPTWRFRAARLSGCKVPRVYKFAALSRPRR
jgi:hypothetical protein